MSPETPTARLRRMSLELRDEALIRVKGGESVKAVAAEIGVGYMTIYQWMHRAGFPTPGRAPLAECGTISAYQRHKRRHEPVDDACREIARLKSKEAYHAGPKVATRAQAQATSRLVAAHRDEYRAYYAEIRDKLQAEMAQ